MSLILLWLGGLSFAGCIVWADLFGFSTQIGLAILATLALALVGWKGLERRRRLETLLNLGSVYYIAGTLAFFAILFWDLFSVDSVPLSWWTVAFLFIVGFGLVIGCRRLLKRRGMLLDLRSTPWWLKSEFRKELCERYNSLSEQPEALRRIRLSGHKAVSGYTQYGPMYRNIGRISFEHHAQLPCVIRAKAGSVSVYEMPAYAAWVAREGSWRRQSYLDNPFSVPKRTKPSSDVQQALLLDHGELVAGLKAISKELKGELIEVRLGWISVLLKKYELTPEEFGSACDLLLRVEAMLNDYTKGDGLTK